MWTRKLDGGDQSPFGSRAITMPDPPAPEMWSPVRNVVKMASPLAFWMTLGGIFKSALDSFDGPGDTGWPGEGGWPYRGGSKLPLVRASDGEALQDARHLAHSSSTPVGQKASEPSLFVEFVDGLARFHHQVVESAGPRRISWMRSALRWVARVEMQPGRPRLAAPGAPGGGGKYWPWDELGRGGRLGPLLGFETMRIVLEAVAAGSHDAEAAGAPRGRGDTVEMSEEAQGRRILLIGGRATCDAGGLSVVVGILAR